MTPEASIAALLEVFHPGKRFILTSHARPDGDAIGSVLGLAELLDQLGCQVDVVLADNFSGASDAVSYLLKLGHRTIGYIGEEPRENVETERFAGYSRALAEYGVERREAGEQVRLPFGQAGDELAADQAVENVQPFDGQEQANDQGEHPDGPPA